MWTSVASVDRSELRHWLHDTSRSQDLSMRSPDIIDSYYLSPNPDPSIAAVEPSPKTTTTDDLERSLALAQTLVKENAQILGSLKTALPLHEELKSSARDLSSTSTKVNNSPLDQSPLSTFPLRSVKSFGSHRAGHIPSEDLGPTPRAKVARPPPGFHSPTHLSGSLAHRLNVAFENMNNSPPAMEAPPPTTLLSTSQERNNKSPPTARFASLKSPCFFHERFDEAVNLDRVLEEITSEETGISRSRLMQTATSVREISKQLQRKPIKSAVRTIMIITKARDNSLTQLTRDLAEWLLLTPRYNSGVGVTVYVDAKLQKSKRFDAPSLLAKDPRMQHMLKYWTPDLCYTRPETFDLVLTLGGDGTVLFTSWLFQRVVPPVLSFSLGSLGFLTNFQYTSYKTHLNSLMGDRGMRVNLRMRFTCTVFHARDRSLIPSLSTKTTQKPDNNDLDEGERFSVLNELVIDRGPSPYVSNLELYGDGQLLTIVQADGCIFSTPTGSTAYSLSAGGPLTHPEIPGIVLSPICPHTLSFRPMVLSDSMLLRVCVPKGSRSTAYASFDGKGRVELRKGDCIQVEAGRYPFPTVVGEQGAGGEWFESVRRALRWNTRGAVQKAFSNKGKGVVVAKEDSEEEETVKNVKTEGPGDEEDQEEQEEEEWDIDVDPPAGDPTSPMASSTASTAFDRDSALGASTTASTAPSVICDDDPLRGC